MPESPSTELPLCDACLDAFLCAVAPRYPDLDTSDLVRPHPEL